MMVEIISSLLVESIIIALLSCAILLLLLRSHAPPPSIKRPINRRTFRISSIPPDVTERDLRTYLLEDSTQDDFTISLAPYSHGKIQIATVTFTRTEPSRFSECRTDERLYLRMEGMQSRIIVDCDFQGVTPLYSAKGPTVEWVEVPPVRSFNQELTTECAVLLLSPGLLDTHSDRGSPAPKTIRCG
jgi:hypothetical protein